MKMPALLSTIALAVFLPLGAQAQNKATVQDHSKKLASLSGKVASAGKTLTADKDSKISGVDGGHVKVKALVVSAIAEEPGGVGLRDAAFRR